MRVMLKARRCAKRRFLFIAVLIFGFSVYSFFVAHVSIITTSDSFATQTGSRRSDTNAAVPESRLSKAWQNIFGSESDFSDEEILSHVVNSRAGNFTYISPGHSPVYDSSRGQFGVIDKFLNKKEHGFFVELGTEGNEAGSLTFLLERSRGWTGLVIEPDVEKFKQLMGMKRNSKFLQACLNATSENWPRNGYKEKPCFRVSDILNAIKCKRIDLLVLDVTGQELALLTSFPFKDIDVSMISIEMHGTNRNVMEIVDEIKTHFISVQLMTNHIHKKTDILLLNKLLQH